MTAHGLPLVRAKLRPILAAMEGVVRSGKKNGSISPEAAEVLRLSLSQAHAVLDNRFSAARGALTEVDNPTS